MSINVCRRQHPLSVFSVASLQEFLFALPARSCRGFLSSTARAFLRYVAESGNVISSSIIQQHRMSDSRDTVPRNSTAERPC
ncbi:unnamed protein product [Calypogeia fissa]